MPGLNKNTLFARLSAAHIMLLVIALSIVGFSVFVFSYNRVQHAAQLAKVKNHAEVISGSLWSFEKKVPEAYLTLALDANKYTEVVVKNEYDEIFLRITADNKSRLDALLQSVKLMHTHRLVQEVIFEKRVIGHIIVSWPCRNIYIYCYIALCLILLLIGVALFLQLLEVKRQLENRVKERTSELEKEISIRKQAETELQLHAQRLSMHVKNTPLGVVEWSPDFEVVDWNKSAEKIFGYTREEALGKKAYELILVEQEREYVDEIWKKLLSQKGGTQSVNANMTRSGEKRMCAWYNTPLVGAAGETIGVASLVLDISDQVKAEEENKILQEQLLQAQKMEAVGNIAGGIAHDFNNIIHSISGYTQLLLLEKEHSGEDLSKLKGIEKTANRAAELVRQLLTFSRKIESNLVPLDLNDEITQIKTILDRSIPKMIEISIACAPDIHMIKGDPVQIEQIILNLAINASHAMENGGGLILETSNRVLTDEFCVKHLGATPGANVCLRVSDTGIGMDEETISRIFEPFFTTKETGKGTGLGLASVYGIVKAHKAYIHCQSVLGKGTTFSLYFPAVFDSMEKRVTTKDDTNLPGGRETILLIDDEESIREIGVEMLTSYGYTVHTASSGEEGLEIYEKRALEVDIVILDLNMPGIGGFICLQKIKESYPDSVVLVASGYTLATSFHKATELGADGFLSKPFLMANFLQTVRSTLDDKKR